MQVTLTYDCNLLSVSNVPGNNKIVAEVHCQVHKGKNISTKDTDVLWSDKNYKLYVYGALRTYVEGLDEITIHSYSATLSQLHLTMNASGKRVIHILYLSSDSTKESTLQWINERIMELG